MIDWADSAAALIARLLDQVATLKTCIHIKEAETGNEPVVLPAAYVAMAKTTFAGAGGGRLDAEVTWQILVRCKRMDGVSGCLSVAEDVAEAAAGFQLMSGHTPLALLSVDFFREEMRPEPAYLITLSTTADHLPTSMHPC